MNAESEDCRRPDSTADDGAARRADTPEAQSAADIENLMAKASKSVRLTAWTYGVYISLANLMAPPENALDAPWELAAMLVVAIGLIAFLVAVARRVAQGRWLLVGLLASMWMGLGSAGFSVWSLASPRVHLPWPVQLALTVLVVTSWVAVVRVGQALSRAASCWTASRGRTASDIRQR